MLAPLAGGTWWWVRTREARELALSQQEARAAEAFEPALDALGQAAAPAEPAYDLDETIRIIHGLDRALQDEKDLEGWLRRLARQDYRDVAPEVLEARRELLGVLQPLYAKQVELEDQQAMWEFTSELMLATLSVVSVSADVDMVSPSGDFSVDREQAQELWRDVKERRAGRKQLQRDLAGLETELFDALVDYADTYYTFVEEWDELSVLRDRAYLASFNGDWPAAEAAADAAIAQAPKEREAHLLKAMALIEGNGGPEALQEAEGLLTDLIDAHPDQTAPTLLLLGVLQAKQGDHKAATLSLQQSTAYYPKQAEYLLDMLDPYRMRGFLRQTREGSFILELYKSTMLGSGYFSPDLQQAKLLFDSGDFNGGRAKVLDHFARRRSQEQWDFVISDIQFCHELLGPDFWRIFPEDTYLDLEVSATMMGSALNLSVNNRSPRTLRNGTLVLALHLTDQSPGMYEALPAPQTVPAVLPHTSTSFGTVDIELEVNGKPKTVDDIVQHRAILISNEAVSWVDTDEFKIAQADEAREARRVASKAAPKPVAAPSASGAPAPKTDRGPVASHPRFQETYDSVVAGLSQGVDLHVEQKYGSDNVLVELPRELAILRPVFRLKYGEQIFKAEDNLIEGDSISLRFAGVENFDDLESAEDMELVMASPFGDIVLTWTADGQLTWNYDGVEVPP